MRSSSHSGVIRRRRSDSLRAGMKSVSRTSPPGVEKRVSRTLVSGAYQRSAPIMPAGAMRKRPPSRASSSAPKSEGLSNPGQQSQSTEPPREISAAERESPTSA